jgi:hypothetical protein
MEKSAIVKNGITKKIILYELIGFTIVEVLLFLDEVIDLPHLCGASATPINWLECLFEALYVMVLCGFVVLSTWQCLRRIKYLEGFLRVCAFCKRICVGNEWVPIEQYIQDHSEAEFSHGLCSQCMKEHYGVTAED